MPTMFDVASRAGVSISTVSYALTGTRSISDETKRRIFTAMEELGYQPHALARGLASKRSHIIALLLPTTERGLGIAELEFVTSAVDTARELGYSLVLWTFEASSSRELTHLVQQGLVDGMVVMEVYENDQRVQTLKSLGVPFSMIGRCADCSDIPYADTDFVAMMKDTVAYLKNLGHRHIAFINQSKAIFDQGYGPAIRSQQAFIDAATTADVFGTCQFCHPAPKEGYIAFETLKSKDPALSAVVVMNDLALPGILWAINDRGLKVPENISLVSVVSSLRASQMYKPSITTMEHSSSKLAQLGVEYLVRQLEGGTSEIPHVLLPCRFVEAGSSGPYWSDV